MFAGRVSLKPTLNCRVGYDRFMQESRNSIENTLKSKEKEVTEEMQALAKKAKVSRPRFAFFSNYSEIDTMTA